MKKTKKRDSKQQIKLDFDGFLSEDVIDDVLSGVAGNFELAREMLAGMAASIGQDELQAPIIEPVITPAIKELALNEPITNIDAKTLSSHEAENPLPVASIVCSSSSNSNDISDTQSSMDHRRKELEDELQTRFVNADVDIVRAIFSFCDYDAIAAISRLSELYSSSPLPQHSSLISESETSPESAQESSSALEDQFLDGFNIEQYFDILASEEDYFSSLDDPQGKERAYSDIIALAAEKERQYEEEKKLVDDEREALRQQEEEKLELERARKQMQQDAILAARIAAFHEEVDVNVSKKGGKADEKKHFDDSHRPTVEEENQLVKRIRKVVKHLDKESIRMYLRHFCWDASQTIDALTGSIDVPQPTPSEPQPQSQPKEKRKAQPLASLDGLASLSTPTPSLMFSVSRHAATAAAPSGAIDIVAKVRPRTPPLQQPSNVLRRRQQEMEIEAEKVKIEKLKGLFPKIGSDVVEDIFETCQKNLVAAIQALERMVPIEHRSAALQQKEKKRAVSPISNAIGKNAEGSAAVAALGDVENWKDVKARARVEKDSKQQQQQSSSGIVSYEKSRAEAMQYVVLRNTYFQMATQAYLRGDGNAARDYSRQGRMYHEQWMAASEAASSEIFDHHNRDVNDDTTIDLHGLHVHEANNRLKQHIESLESHIEFPARLNVITGVGSHSSGGIAKILPAVRQFCNLFGFKYTEPLPGVIRVLLDRRRLTK